MLNYENLLSFYLFIFKSFWVNKIVVFVEKVLLIIVLEILYI